MIGLLAFSAVGLWSLYKILIQGIQWLRKRKQIQ
jgi:uncharacterized membrane protein